MGKHARSKSQSERSHVGGAQMAQAWNGQQPSLLSSARRNSRDTHRVVPRGVLSRAGDVGVLLVGMGFDPLFNSML